MAIPDFLIIGSPKAGSTALHVALARHPDLFLSDPKEPKFFMCDRAKPDPAQQRGPGDAHSAQEWVWDPARYEALFAAAPATALRGESTPFYLWDKASHRRIHALIPDVKMIAVIRDPIDRAYSNWGHLWCDGLEPESDFFRACELEPERIKAGYAPFWRYLETGLYGQQLEHLFGIFSKEQIFVLRYRQLIDNTAAILDEICAFLGVRTGQVSTIPRSNVSTGFRTPRSTPSCGRRCVPGPSSALTCRHRCGGKRSGRCWRRCIRVVGADRPCRSSSVSPCWRTSRRTTPCWAGSPASTTRTG